jgi:hypothetical protein
MHHMNRIRFPTIIGLFLCFIGVLTPLCFGDSSNNDGFDSNTPPERELASLAEKWSIAGPVNFNYASLVFSLTYQTSDYIENGMIEGQLYDQDCAEGGNVVGSIFLSSQVTSDGSVPLGSGDATRDVLVEITMDPETISQSEIYSEVVIDDQVLATVRFCHRFMLFATPTSGTPLEVNFRETLVILTVDLTDGFEIGTIDVVDKDKLIQTANAAYQVEGYRCDFTNTPLTELELAESRAQGTIIRVCVRPDSEARAYGIFMRSLDSFVFERYYEGSVGTVTQTAIENGSPASNQLTALYCTPGDAVCVFETILMAGFFRLPGQVEGTGIASMQFGYSSPSRRGLRALQQNGGTVAAVSEFDLKVELLPVIRPRRQSDGRRSRGASFLLSSAFALVLPLLIL